MSAACKRCNSACHSSARHGPARLGRHRRVNQMNHRAAACTQPVAVDRKRRTRTLRQPGAVDKKASCGLEVGGDDRCVIELHDGLHKA